MDSVDVPRITIGGYGIGDMVKIVKGETKTGIPDSALPVNSVRTIDGMRDGFLMINGWVLEPEDLEPYTGEPEEQTEPENPKQRYGDKKVPLHLVPPSAVIYAALGMREGAEKYGAWNFRESRVEVMTYVGAILRHLYAFVDGATMDYDCTYPKPHLAGAMASLAILIDAIESDRAVDNRPRAPITGAAELLDAYKLP